MAEIIPAMAGLPPEFSRPVPRLPAVEHPASTAVLKCVVGERSVELCRYGETVLPADFGAGSYERQIARQCHALHRKRRTWQRQETDIDGRLGYEVVSPRGAATQDQDGTGVQPQGLVDPSSEFGSD